MAKTLKEKGRAIRKEILRYGKGDAVLFGVKPKPGMWIIDRKKQKAYGQIDHIKRNGTVVWRGTAGVFVRTDPNTLFEQGCEYVEKIPEGFERLTR